MAGIGTETGSPPRSGATPQRPVALWAPAHQWTEERRMHRRILIEDLPVTLHVGVATGRKPAAVLTGHLINLSAGGCCVAVASETVDETLAAHLVAGRACRIGLPVRSTGWTYYRATVLRAGHHATRPELTLRLRFGPSAPIPQQHLTRWLLQLWLRSWHAAPPDPAAGSASVDVS